MDPVIGSPELTTGGWRCSICAALVPYDQTHICGGTAPASNIPFVTIPFVTAPTGWLCVKCGRCNAPFVTTCECGPNTAIKVGGV